MSSSISASDPQSSDPRAWRRFLLWLVGSGMGFFLFVYVFVAVVDPWGVLPLSPPLPRVPISTNARFSFPALARSPAFDAAVFGTSTTRLLRPAILNGLFGAHFVNLAMNSATAWEQSRMLALFAHAHPAARMVIIGLDGAWCNMAPQESSGRPFPRWMYAGSPWRGYREVANLYAVQEAANQFAVLVGMKRPRYGLDGYTDFLPDERLYDPVRVAQIFAQWGPAPDIPTIPGAVHVFPALSMLAKDLAALPAGTRKLLFFTPSHVDLQGNPGSDIAAVNAACKSAVASIAAGAPGTEVVDFLIPSPITRDRDNYWDPLHYRVPIADRIMRDLAAASQGRPSEDDRLLVPADGAS
jgi:hypothetical protein